MRTIIIIETAKELMEFINPGREEGNKTPYLGTKYQLVFENEFSTVFLSGTPDFELDGNITVESVITELAKKAGVKVHIT